MQDNLINVFLEYQATGSVSNTIEKFGKFSQESLIQKYAKQVLEGLEYLHLNNLVHGDIKGANVLLDKKGDAKIADFGNSKNIFAEELSLGTTRWMAPEVMREGRVSRQSDIWSFGCLMLEMITGQAPYHELKSETQESLLFQLSEIQRAP